MCSEVIYVGVGKKKVLYSKLELFQQFQLGKLL